MLGIPSACLVLPDTGRPLSYLSGFVLLQIGHTTMAIKIIISDKVGFTVKGTINDADGKEQPFDFTLTAKRLDEDALGAAQSLLVVDAAKTGGHTAVIEKLAEITTNWTGVRDESDAQVPYSADTLRALLKSHRGLGLLIWRTYISEAGAKEKN